MIPGLMADSKPSLAERLLAGDKRALARGISLVEDDDPEGWALVREIYPHTGSAAVVGFTGPPGAGKSTLIGSLVKLRRRRRPPGRGALDRPVLAVPRRRAARRPHPPDRALPRPGRLHPLDGDPRRARRPRRGGAPDRAADGRRRQGRRLPRDRRRRPGRGRRDRPRRHRRARADPGLRRLDPGAQGRRDGDPGHHRRQQVRPPADRHDGARDPRRALARARSRDWPVPIIKTEAAPRRGRREARREARRAPRSSSRTEGCWPSAAGATCATRCSGIATVRLRRALEASLHEDPEVQALLDEVVARRLDPASAASAILARGAVEAGRRRGRLSRPKPPGERRDVNGRSRAWSEPPRSSPRTARSLKPQSPAAASATANARDTTATPPRSADTTPTAATAPTAGPNGASVPVVGPPARAPTRTRATSHSDRAA